ncbi:hypothetical protein JCM21714_4427 [Gracilibacillus boraciitolerans JCM 21714]|uniref:Uncharacterized protein n=1 Tax=Gracilibacillus boraciitolerans JCM 21714 TaxID=1298598 RepID=W4VQM7_9BACI|nr:hypothetical protein [Gracilibacillus boraciitolerans]GAE95213.1 hypothetical protein JCM21714_4427 [Gracilibacillus boraciitolerans JCM 21714]
MDIAGLNDRIKPELTWDEEWFESINGENINQVKKTFDVGKIIKEYEHFFIMNFIGKRYSNARNFK